MGCEPTGGDQTPCPAHPAGHYVITVGTVTFCMDCGKVYSMGEWHDYLKPEERARLEQIEDEKKTGQLEHRRIYDRCRKRMDKEATGKPLENSPAKPQKTVG